MKKKMGLRPRHVVLVENLMQESKRSLGAGQIKDLLWDKWGRDQPTPRELGTFLKIHPNINKVRQTRNGSEYVWEY